jgi:uncharacterized membrane protein
VESPNQIQEHVDTILKHEQEFLARRTRSERLGDSIASFVGSLNFVAFHVLVFGCWILANTLSISRIPRFDPFSFSLLGTCVSLEAILIASFILMRQARLARRADERDHLMLQILLLAEKRDNGSIENGSSNSREGGTNRHRARRRNSRIRTEDLYRRGCPDDSRKPL